MNKKHFIIILSSFLLISLFILILQFPASPPEKILEESFADSGARIISSEIYLNGEVRSGFNTTDEYKQLVLDISKELGVENGGEFMKAVNNDNIEGFEMDCAAGDCRHIHISAVNGKPGGDMEGRYVTVSVSDTSDSPDLAEIKKGILDITNIYDIDMSADSCITGYYQGKLDDSALNDVCSRILKKADARKVEGMRDSSLISVSAYSPDIGESIQVGGDRINLNLAVRYNSYEDKTYIWLATPIITTEY